MVLTGKAKKDFDKWYFKIKNQPLLGKFRISIYKFEQLPNSMQYGVYLDWFDSVDMEVFIDYSRADMFRFDIFHHFISLGNGSPFKTRQEARTEAIKKANEIYNSR